MRAAFEGYREVNGLHPVLTLSYEKASNCNHGNTLADSIDIELTEGVENEDDVAVQCDRGVIFIERAIRDLRHIQSALARKEREQENGAS